MAQWKPGPFDEGWQRKLESGLRLLREASDKWALAGIAAADVNQVLSLLTRLFSGPWSTLEMTWADSAWFRPLEQWLSKVGSLEVEISRFRKRQSKDDIALVAVELHAALEMAAQNWSEFGAENPPTHEVLFQLVAIFFRHGLVRRPPPRNPEDI